MDALYGVELLESLHDVLEKDDCLQLTQTLLLLLRDKFLKITVLAELEEHVQVISRPSHVVELDDVWVVDLLEDGNFPFDQF